MANVGYATLQIVPSMRGVQSQLTSGMRGPAGAAGTAAGATMGRSVSSAASGPIRSGFSSLARGVGGILAGIGAARFISGAVKEAEEAIAVGRQTDTVLQSTGASAWTSRGQIEALSAALSKKAGVDDEVIQSGQNVLLTFKEVQNQVGEGNDIFDRATTAALDMSAALGVDMQSATMQLGKALNDPVRGMTRLERAGVSFTQQQKDQVAAMVASGDTLGAQRLIMEEVESQFAGSAEANATASMRMSTAWANLQETAGMVLLPAVNALADGLGSVSEWFSGLSSSGQTVVSVFGLVGVAALAMWAMIGGPATLVVAGIAAVAAGAYALYQRFEPIRSAVDAIWQAIQTGVGFVLDQLRQLRDNFMDLVGSVDWSPLLDAWNTLKGAFSELWSALEPLKPFLIGLAAVLAIVFLGPGVWLLALAAGALYLYNRFEAFRNVVDTIFRVLAEVVLPAIVQGFTNAVNVVTWLVDLFKSWWAFTEPVRAAIVQIAQTVFTGLITGIQFVIALVQGLWQQSEPVRSLLMTIGAIGWYVLKAAVAAVIGLAQALWNRSEPVRQVLATIGGFALMTVRSAVNQLITRGQMLWDKLQPVRDALSTIGGMGLGVLKDAVNAIKSAFDRISNLLDNIRDKINSMPTPSFGGISRLWEAARGGFHRGIGLVGEEGPELVNLGRRGGHITPTRQTRRLLGSLAPVDLAGGSTSPASTDGLAQAVLEGLSGATLVVEGDRAYVQLARAGHRREHGQRGAVR